MTIKDGTLKKKKETTVAVSNNSMAECIKQATLLIMVNKWRNMTNLLFLCV